MLTQVDLIKKYGLSIRGKIGQHLLIDPNIQRKIVDALDLEKGDTVLEIGPGLGALSHEILTRGFPLIAVEKDKRFCEILRKEFEGFGKQFQLIEADILKTDLGALLPKGGRKKAKLVSNMPYYITAPILFHIFEFQKHFKKAVLMMQKEVADRLAASPGSKDYGRLTLAVRYVADLQHHLDVGAGCFTPRPEVGSSVISLEFHESGSGLTKEEEKHLFQIIQTAFSQRRKTLIGLLSRASWLRASRAELEAVLEKASMNRTVRGEELLLKDYLTLLKLLRVYFK